MYKIGDFSKIVGLPIRTLRYYDNYGVLCPSHVDTYTGYRYYSKENIIECELLKLLKSLDFTLQEIIEYKNGSKEAIISKKRNELLDKINLLKEKYKFLLEMEYELTNSKKLVRKVSNNESRDN